MKRKIVKEFEYDGLGFPITLLDVPMCIVRGVDTPDINYNTLQKSALYALALKDDPLTGNQVRFIRQFSEMTYSEFAQQFAVTHPTIIHWENFKDEPVKISATTDICIRLYILDLLKANNKIFRETFKGFRKRKPSRLREKPIKSAGLTLDIKDWD